MPRKRREWVGERNGFLEVIGRDDGRNAKGKLVTKLRCICHSGLSNCKRETVIYASNFASTRSCDCTKHEGKVSNPPRGTREMPLRDRFTDAQIREVRELRNEGELLRTSDLDGTYRTNRMSFVEIASRTGLEVRDIEDICHPIEQRAKTVEKAKREVENAIWAASVARGLEFDPEKGTCVQRNEAQRGRCLSRRALRLLCDDRECPTCKYAGNRKTVNRRFAALVNALEQKGKEILIG